MSTQQDTRNSCAFSTGIWIKRDYRWTATKE